MLKEVHGSDKYDRLRTRTVPMPVTLLTTSFTLIVGATWVRECVHVALPWTEEEHRLFLLGLQKLAKGDWVGISRNYVKTRTCTQVGSHAQKYLLRLNDKNRRRRRHKSSLFDITTTDTN